MGEKLEDPELNTKFRNDVGYRRVFLKILSEITKKLNNACTGRFV